jgi:hypothetical protein
MTRRFIFMVLIAALTMPFVLTQCASNKYVVSSRNKAPDSDRYQIEMDMIYLSKEDLIARFGTQENPYLPPKSLIGGSDVIAFEVTVSNGTPGNGTVVIPLGTMYLVAGQKAFEPVSTFILADYWIRLLDKGSDTNDIKTTGSKMEHVIKKTMWADPAEVKSGERYSGIVAFMGRFTQYGWGEMDAPVFDEQKRVIGIFKEEFERY